MRYWLRNKREELGLTMKQIADKLDISEAYYCQIERGNRQKSMDIALVAKLTNVLGMSLAEIINNEEEK